jgi:sorting nexin-1/2
MNNPGVVVPPAPEKNSFGRFDDTFVQQRRLALEKCIQKIANHPVLSKDPDLKLFLESDTYSLDVSAFGCSNIISYCCSNYSILKIKQRKAEIAHERGGLMASIGQTITGPRFYETDEVIFPTHFYFLLLKRTIVNFSGLIGRSPTSTVSRPNSEV